jgi:Cell cycle and development regulator
MKMKYPDENLTSVRSKIAKMTKYWPLTFSSSIVYSIRQYVEPILAVAAKEDLNEEEILQCQQCIYQLVGIEARHELNLINSQRIKGKKDDQYRLMWNELEVIVGLNGKSAGHKAVLQCIRKVRTQSPEASEKEVDSALGGLRKMLDIGDAPAGVTISILRHSTDSPMSPPPMERHKGVKHRATISLYDIMMGKEQTIANKRIDFSGRLSTPIGQIAALYPQMAAKEAQNDVKV